MTDPLRAAAELALRWFKDDEFPEIAKDRYGKVRWCYISDLIRSQLEAALRTEDSEVI